MYLPKQPRFTLPIEPGNEPIQTGGVADELVLEAVPAFFSDQLCEAHQIIAVLMDRCPVGGLLRQELKSICLEIESVLEDHHD